VPRCTVVKDRRNRRQTRFAHIGMTMSGENVMWTLNKVDMWVAIIVTPLTLLTVRGSWDTAAEVTANLFVIALVVLAWVCIIKGIRVL
jgi:hypothetical protein